MLVKLAEDKKLGPRGNAAVRSLSPTQIFTDNVRYVWRALRHLGVREADLEDVCQDVFIVAFRRLPEFEGRSSLRVWLYGIAVRRASEHRRRAYVRRESPVEAVPEQTVCPRQPEAVETSRKLARVAALLEDLDDEKRAAFVLFELEGLSMNEVAETLGCALPTAYARHRAAREHLRQAIVEKEDP